MFDALRRDLGVRDAQGDRAGGADDAGVGHGEDGRRAACVPSLLRPREEAAPEVADRFAARGGEGGKVAHPAGETLAVVALELDERASFPGAERELREPGVGARCDAPTTAEGLGDL